MNSAFWLIATCPDDSGAAVTSSVYLPGWIENQEGNLTWKDGGNFEETCQNCALINGGSLKCFCDGTYANENGNSTLSLEDHIANYNGHLLSNLDGAPTIPTNSSSVAVPSDATLTMSLSISSNTCASDFTWQFFGPEPCWAFTFVNGRPSTLESIQITTNPGWSIQSYNNSDCSGAPLVSLNQKDVNTCVDLGGAEYLKAVPLWNWD
ncbi:Cyanovirin-N [Talaromyces proteolyticus]|uniref:Cyanovirin-N n=1 Tax=Talaromyces proteolyticus TaxID=1131652 RepID=A0AAD4L1J3_9EURO|nr:Cyanovirin-N [Talaromyces proteolyticus]KAH8705858.1 Cyanovirin-N [Talaromyces proteolyticus]